VCCVVVEVEAASASNFTVTPYRISDGPSDTNGFENGPGGLLMVHDNVRPHAAHATRDTLSRFGWGVLDHPSYSPDISPCDYHVFGPLKGRWFDSDEAVREAVEQ
jgi:hypothetical protein